VGLWGLVICGEFCLSFVVLWDFVGLVLIGLLGLVGDWFFVGSFV